MINHSKPLGCLVVGAGPAGLMMGIELRRHNVDTLILESKAKLERTICGEYLTPGGVELLHRNHLEEIITDFLPIKGMLLVSPSEFSVLAEFPENARGVSVDRAVLHQRLLKLYLSLGGEIEFSKKVTHVEKLTNQGYRVDCVDLTSKSSYFCKSLIGADGRRSSLGKILGVQFKKTARPRVALHCLLVPKKPMSRFGEMHILPDGSYVGINPICDQEVNFSVVTDADRIKKVGDSVEYINHWIRTRSSLSENFNLITKEKVQTTYPLTRRILNPNEFLNRFPRVAFIGDASGFIDPLTGEGMTVVFKTVSLLMHHMKTNQMNLDAKAIYADYWSARQNDFRVKERLNRSLQVVIRLPWLCEILARVFNRYKKIRTVFIGIVSNVYTPLEGIKKLCQKS